MFYQLEITTRCNFSCFYCAGRDMPQKDMEWDAFTQIVDAIPGKRVTVSLQGEGEPSLPPLFEDMARYVRDKGHRPYSILNGSRLDLAVLAGLFPTLGISVDTLDQCHAEEIGRHNLPKVLRQLDDLLRVMDARRVTVMTVDMGQPLDELRAWVRARGFGRHIIQPLSPKADYAKRYTVSTTGLQRSQSSFCPYLQRPHTRFFTWDGKQLPCCFMKDSSDFETISQLRAELLSAKFKRCCHGCPQLRPV
ncbi:radical SAM protein [Rhodoferax sp.]|uniref:radical SAM protein n=1 Tax=Rhodoferax sp. TaxID=50421 RepID=UPI001EC69689|nr:radical SAM protein [Rhodoferax sp.]MBT9508242.1 radical SAM protein [Rhodoferax sp.]